MLLSTYNLINSVQFPTRILNVSSTAIDSIFIDKTRIHTICPIVNGLSDYDAQEIQLDIKAPPKQNYTTKQHRNSNMYSIDEFLINLIMKTGRMSSIVMMPISHLIIS
jgi:hypothetical protein